MDLKDAQANVERSLAVFLEEELIEPEFADTAKLLLYAMNLGCTNIDKLAAASGLARDRFVRPRARRLREAGVWLKEGPVGFESLNGPIEHMSIEFVLHCLIADGLIVRTSGSGESPGVVENPSVEHVPSGGAGV